MKSILDPSFNYVSSVATDLRKTFARVRRELAREARMKARVGRHAKATERPMSSEARVVFLEPRPATAGGD